MKLLMKITAVTKITDERLLVQLQGKYGNAQLNLPISQQAALRVGEEYTLEQSMRGIGIIGELNETEERMSPVSRGVLAGLSGEPL